ncbi:UDP-galactose transporter [Colletotrichum eremochloae]|nr:UDP-galactose transporter [Colletotrichum eremochloae]
MYNNEKGDYVVHIPNNSHTNRDARSTAAYSPHAPFSGSNDASEGTSQIENSSTLCIVAYCLSSISMTVVNKYVVSGSSWNLTFFYLTVQTIVSTTAILAAKKLRLLNAIAPLDPTKAKKCMGACPPTGMIYTGNKALQFLSVPVYTIFKNLTIIVIAYGEVLWFGGRVTPMALLSFSLMVLSSIIATWADQRSASNAPLSTDGPAIALSTLYIGYAWMALNVLCSASYVLSMRKVIKRMNFTDWDTMFYNNVLTIPVLLFCSLTTEDWSAANVAKNFPESSRNKIMIGMIYSGLAAILISYSSAWCIRVTSSTTYSMVGALNKLPIAISGLLFFSAPVTVGSVSAIVVGFISGIVYSWARMR